MVIARNTQVSGELSGIDLGFYNTCSLNFVYLHLNVLCSDPFLHLFPFFCSDWYNLEKSKRVKAFRCGEFDACIEKALTSRGTPVKRREKYARREDAILHALELEKKLLASKHQTQGSRPANVSGKPIYWQSLI